MDKLKLETDHTLRGGEFIAYDKFSVPYIERINISAKKCVVCGNLCTGGWMKLGRQFAFYCYSCVEVKTGFAELNKMINRRT